MNSQKIKEMIDQNIEYLSQLTKEEVDFILYILSWNEQQIYAFKIAKQIFEEEMNNDWMSLPEESKDELV